MIDFTNVIDIMLGQNQVTQIEDSLGNVLWSAAPADEYFYVEDISGADNTLSIKKADSSAPTIEVFYSTDQQNWTSMGQTSTTAITATVPANSKLYLKATADVWSNNLFKYNYFNLATGNFNVGGNIMSLLYGDTFNVQSEFPSNAGYTFNRLFYYNKNLVNASNLLLPATTLASDCYQGMFDGCSSLTTAPALPATTLASYCYQSMFARCSSLTTAPALPATTLAQSCYNGMFSGCTHLTTAPALPATTLASGCYFSMFNGCTALTTAPALPATTLAIDCYRSMFNGCTALTTAPALPATTMNTSCYQGMFQGCTHLTTAPSLPATTLAQNCYNNIFYNCTSLTSAPATLPATTMAQYCYGNMFYGCTHLTTAPALPATTLAPECYRGMFYNCTSLTTAPALPATTLSSSCYRVMFYNCTSLTSAPSLPATTLVDSCYYNMFYGCTSLTSVITYANDISASNCVSLWLNNVAATGDFYNLGSATYTADSASGIPTGWIERTALPEYFYIENVSNDTATVSFNAGSDTTINIKVSTDKSNWVDLGLITNAPTYSLPAGGKLYISATGDTWNFATIKCNKSFNVGGYIMSLLKGDNFSTNNHFSNEQTTQFGGIFGDNNTLISANNLILATNTDSHCYQWMFAGCTSLTASPVLSAATLVDSCYSYMFYNCTSLNSVITYANISTGGCNNWLYNVAATGDFFNLGGATYESGASGIPTGWTEHTSL